MGKTTISYSAVYNLLKEVSNRDQEGKVQSNLGLRCSRYRKSGKR